MESLVKFCGSFSGASQNSIEKHSPKQAEQMGTCGLDKHLYIFTFVFFPPVVYQV